MFTAFTAVDPENKIAPAMSIFPLWRAQHWSILPYSGMPVETGCMEFHPASFCKSKHHSAGQHAKHAYRKMGVKAALICQKFSFL